jgi:uncharacterized membrane protein
MIQYVHDSVNVFQEALERLKTGQLVYLMVTVTMQRPWSGYAEQLSTGFRALVAFFLILGITLRFVHLDQKIYWLDEAFTSLHISGYSDAEVMLQAGDGKAMRNQDFLRYQAPSPVKGIGDTVQRIAQSAPELPPLYFVLARLWQQGFGPSITAIRSFSALLSILAFPCIYWLCWELWRSPLTGWVAVMLVAISPLHLETAQEARPYSLLIFIALASHAALLRARRIQTRSGWMLYSSLMAMGFYTHLLFGLVLLVHGLYMGFVEHWHWRSPLRAYLAASCVALGAFLPWVFLALKYLPRNQPALSPEHPSGIHLVGYWIKGWVRGLSLVFVDFNLNENNERIQLISFSIILLVLLTLIAYAGCRVWRSESNQTRFFWGLAIAVPALAIILINILTDSIQSTTARYWWPTYLGIQLLIARFFVTHAIAISPEFPGRKLWRTTFTGLLSMGILSCLVFSQSQFWWNKTGDRQIYQSAQIINAAQQPLVVSDAFFVGIFPLSHLLKPDVTLQLSTEPNIPPISAQNKTVFLYRPSVALLQSAAQRHPIPLTSLLWRCSHPSTFRSAALFFNGSQAH